MFSNLVNYLSQRVSENPDRTALVVPVMQGEKCLREEKVSYSDIAKCISQYQLGWKNMGLQKGDRVILLFRPCVDLYAMVISLIALGMVPVFIDTGMPKKKIKMALADSNAKAIVSLSGLVRLFWFIPAMWRMKRFSVDGEGFGYRAAHWLLQGEAKADFEVVAVGPDDNGLISFTSGSTGRPKGADRTHASLENQHLTIRGHLPDREGDIDMTCFPVWVLHNMCCGMTTIMPKVDLATPGDINPRLVLDQLDEFEVTRVSAAPAFMGQLTKHMADNEIKNEKINLAFTGGATVPVEVAKNMIDVFPNATSEVVYGSTEAEPISSIHAQEFLRDADLLDGYLVGAPVDGVEVCIAKLPDKPVQEKEVIDNMMTSPQLGEILVSGKHVLKAYVDNIEATRENKVTRENGLVWHRTGDTGYIDDTGRIWLTGRVKDVITRNNQWVQPFPLEKRLDETEGIVRAALVEEGEKLYLFIESQQEVSSLLEAIAPTLAHLNLAPVRVASISKVPLDARHNSKIDRPLLRENIRNGAVDEVGVI